ncbi:MAG: (Fe-S)-binding protein [Candidatus Helarchaeota archaeon]|nr:(Fe-S)-binding protein [Candidatus Helarchaeota archaeon]
MLDLEKKLRLVVPALKNAVKKCEVCGLCLQNCYLEKFNPKLATKIMKSIKEYIMSDFKTSLSGNAKTVIWRCCVDEFCHQFCPQGISKAILMIGLRFVLLQKGAAPFLLQFAEYSLRKYLYKNPDFPIQRIIMRIFGHLGYPNKWIEDKNREKVTRRLERAKNPRFDQIKEGATLFMPGCGHTYGMPNLVQLTMAIFDKADVKYHTIGTPEFCCGGFFLVAGFIKSSLLIGERTGKLLSKLKPERVITACPGCYMAYSAKKFPTGRGNQTFNLPLSTILEDAGIEVIYLSDYLEELIKAGQIKFKRKINRPIGVLSSCSTGKRNVTVGKGQLSESQHEILKSIPGVDYRELTFSGENSRCCGITAKLIQKVASLTSPLNQDLAFKSQKEVVNDALSRGVRDVTTVCGGCLLTYGDGLKQMGDPIRLWDIQELVAYAMGINIYPRQHNEFLNWMRLSPPFFKVGMISAIPRLIEATSVGLKYFLHRT